MYLQKLETPNCPLLGSVDTLEGRRTYFSAASKSTDYRNRNNPIKTFVSMLLFPPSVCPFSPSTWPSVNAGVALHGAWGHPQVLFILEPAL